MPPRKRPAAKSSGSQKAKSQSGDKKSDEVNFLDTNTEQCVNLFAKYSKEVLPGRALIMPALDKNGFVLGEVLLKGQGHCAAQDVFVCAGGVDLLVKQGGQSRDESYESQGCLAPPVQDNQLLQELGGGEESASC